MWTDFNFVYNSYSIVLVTQNEGLSNQTITYNKKDIRILTVNSGITECLVMAGPTNWEW